MIAKVAKKHSEFLASGDAQSQRVCAGLGPIEPMAALTALFQLLIEQDASFIETTLHLVLDIDVAGVIPNVLDMARVTLETSVSLAN
jgi:hypothetical protein